MNFVRASESIHDHEVTLRLGATVKRSAGRVRPPRTIGDHQVWRRSARPALRLTVAPAMTRNGASISRPRGDDATAYSALG